MRREEAASGSPGYGIAAAQEASADDAVEWEGKRILEQVLG